jgi:hypothetical protein
MDQHTTDLPFCYTIDDMHSNFIQKDMRLREEVLKTNQSMGFLWSSRPRVAHTAHASPSASKLLWRDSLYVSMMKVG